ncbi:MAG: riboflavin synthase [Woeseiaceae bacterium]
MFTGIVKALGTVSGVQRHGGDLRLSIDSDGIDRAVAGDSMAVNGVCLTVVQLTGRGFATDVSTETLARTTLSALERGQRVNLEPALAIGDRLGGHLVSGHVDCVGSVRSLRRDARSLRLAVAVPADCLRYLAVKGSVCVDGVSLTINAVSGDMMEVNIIPHTAESTTIGSYVKGTAVNIEVDLLARYLERLLAPDAGSGITRDFLKRHGYA